MVSVIIPVFNEEKVLPETLQALLVQPGDYEVIVVDGGSTDCTTQVLRKFGFADHRSPITSSLSSHTMWFTVPKGRASQMNVGATFATGEWLLFFHADTILPDGALMRLNRMEADRTIQACGFMHRFSGNDWRLKLISYLDNLRCRHSRIIYGDQALFVLRSLFQRLDGFPNQPILEDVAFCEKLTRVTTPLVVSPPVVTDARKFLKMGVWRSFLRVLLIILHIEFRLPVLPRVFFQDIR
jgi:rSAM/selenodomain-associated transferase 2